MRPPLLFVRLSVLHSSLFRSTLRHRTIKGGNEKCNDNCKYENDEWRVENDKLG